MAYYVFINDQCKKEAQKMGFMLDIENLAKKLEKDQTTAGLDRFPVPFLKKNLGKKHRLIIQEFFFNEDIVLCFLRVFNHDRIYEKEFLGEPSLFKLESKYENELKQYWMNRSFDSPIELPALSELEKNYITPKTVADSDEIILESEVWVNHTLQNQQLVFAYHNLISIVLENPQKAITKNIFTHPDSSGIKISCKYFSKTKKLFLIAPVDPDELNEHEHSIYNKIIEYSQEVNEIELLRLSKRSYPAFITLDFEIWCNTQKNIEANLALSPEEVEVLESVNGGGMGNYPLFVNGRPGSGKSTVLQYLFSEHLHFHLSRPANERLHNPPLMLTYNKELLEESKRTIKNIILCNGTKIVENRIFLEKPEILTEFNKCFGVFPNFLYDLLPIEFKKKLVEAKRIDFFTFKKRWYKKFAKSPNQEIRSISPELAWHIIRTFIKGMQQVDGDYFDTFCYKNELPKSQRTVTQSTFDLVYENIFDRWYRTLCKEEGFWDDQDLARMLLDAQNEGNLNTEGYPIIFCDEAQDFTKVELEVIWKLSIYPKRKIPSYLLSCVPFAFAGDPFQTLNPTGFNWKVVESGFHEKIVRSLDCSGKSDLKINIKNLTLNYRSIPSIVKLCNLIHLVRGIIFNVKDLTPQQTWFESINDTIPEFFSITDSSTLINLKEQNEIIIIVPCQEGEEEEFARTDEFLSTIAFNDNNEIVKNILSPMRAKGRQFDRVVLYKFGDACSKDYRILLEPLKSELTYHMSPDSALPLEYFMNRLYVAASRAQKQLIIVDTELGMEFLWTFAKDIKIESLIELYGNNDWKISDLIQLQPGSEGSWTHTKDNPEVLAKRFFEDGIANQDPYLLRLASQNYKAGNETLQAKRALAKAYEFEDNYSKAGKIYLDLNEVRPALECFWRVSDYNEVLKLGKINNEIKDRIEYRASLFMTNNGEYTEALNLLEKLASHLEIPEKKAVLCESLNWRHVFEKIYTIISKFIENDQIKLPLSQWIKVYKQLLRLIELDLINPRKEILARIAFNAEEYKTSLDLLSQSNIKHSESDWVLEAKSKALEYPKNIEPLYKSGRSEEIIAEYEKFSNKFLPESTANMIFEVAVNKTKFGVAYQLTRKYTDEKKLIILLEELFGSGEKQYLKMALIDLIRYLVVNERWSDVILLIEQNVSEGHLITISKKLKEARVSKTALRKVLILEIVKIESTSDGIVERGVLSEYLSKLFLQKGNIRVFNLPMEVIGAAFERTGKIVESLKFYEELRRGGVGFNKDIDTFARIRWAKNKQKHAILSNNDPQKLKEAEQFRSRYKLPRLQDIENLPQIDSNMIDELLNGIVNDKEFFEIKKIIEKQVPIEKNSKISQQTNKINEFVLGFKNNGIVFKLTHYYLISKVEIKNRNTTESLIIFGKKKQIQSLEIELIHSDKLPGLTICESWGLAFNIETLDDKDFLNVYSSNVLQKLLTIGI